MTEDGLPVPGCRCPTRWSQPHWRILCYHAIPDDLTGAFRAPLAAFRERGFSFVDLDQGLKLWQGHGFPQPMMTVAFDDGYRTVYESALPILEEPGIKGFHYLVVDYIDKGRNYRRKAPLPTMSWDQARQWIRIGHGVGRHTFSHVALDGCSDSG